jgi:ferredoxin
MIKIVVQNPTWVEIGSFEAQKWKLITEMAQSNNVEIPFSCGAWACGLCLCEVIEWRDLINGSFLNHPLMELHDNEVLTCISAINDEYFEKEWDYTIILKRKI